MTTREKLFTVIYKTEKTVTNYVEAQIWAEDENDAEALAENDYNDGHVFNDGDFTTPIGTVVGKEVLQNIFIQEG